MSTVSTTIAVAMPPAAVQILSQLDQALAASDALQIDSDDAYEIAGIEAQAVNKFAKELEDHRFSITRPMDEAKKRAIELFRPSLEKANTIVQRLSRKMADYETKKRREREEAERKAREEAAAEAARQREEAERIRREAERQAREAREAAEAARRRAQEAADAEAAREAAEAEKAAQRAADEAAAANIEATAVEQAADLVESMPVPVPVSAAPKVKGATKRTNWKFEVVDLHALIKAAAAALEEGDKSIAMLLAPDSAAIGQRVRSMRDAMKVPGIRVFDEAGMAFSRK